MISEAKEIEFMSFQKVVYKLISLKKVLSKENLAVSVIKKLGSI